MRPEEYYNFIKTIQEEEFPNTFDELEFVKKDDGRNFFFAPSHHFNIHKPLMTEQIVAHLRKGKKILSVGCGPAYLERLLVSRLDVNKDQITLADISDKYVPEGFEFYQFDMYEDWPDLGTFDYVIFPESALVNNRFSGKMGGYGVTIRHPEREDGLYCLLKRALNVLNIPGQIRMTSGVTDTVRDPVKERIEKEFSNVRMHYSSEWTCLIKRN